ncbi:DNA binding protein [Phytophthora megakarya]|uniref:DNA binding protein n=1 Tax=Phytophthora megakarya TaxID=4795 RepID=A0A225UW20_9STRA|nr:DNA binding protein [Phytophthora megakarya]
MTTNTLQGWVHDVDASMRAQDCHTLIHVDNASSHNTDGLVITYVRVGNLPANTTSKRCDFLAILISRMSSVATDWRNLRMKRSHLYACKHRSTLAGRFLLL